MTTKLTKTAILTTAASIALIMTGCGKKTENATCPAAIPQDQDQPDTIISQPVQMAAAEPLSKTVVTVNGKPLMRVDLMKEMEMLTSSPQFAAMPPEQANMMRQQMETRFVNRFVNQVILTAEAKKQNIEITGAQVDEMLEEIRGSIPPEMTLEKILEERGMSMEKLRTDISTDLRIRNLLEKHTENLPPVTDDAIAAFYEENKARFNAPESAHARHILIKVDEDADDETKATKKVEIEGYRKQLVDGTAEFEALAGEHSDCPSGKKGGDLGSFGRGQMVGAFETAAFEQDIDAIGPVIETQFGYHIVQVLGREEAGERNFEDVKEEIAQQIEGRGKQEAVETYITALRDKAEITYGDK